MRRKKMEQMNQNSNVEISHGLLAEDFKQNLLNLVQNHKLDIQTKVIILDSILLATNLSAKQQTERELIEYRQKTNLENSDKEA